MYLVYAINIYDFFINFYILKSSFHLNLTCQRYLMDMFHMDSMWNLCGMNPCGIHMESIWNLCGIHSSNYLIYMPKHIPYGFHVDSMEYIHSTWIPYEMWGGGKVNL